MMTRNADNHKKLRDALILWLNAAQTAVKANFDSLVMAVGTENWHELPNGDLQKFPNRFYYRISQLDKLIFDELAEWNNLAKCISQDSQFSRHTTEMIGSQTIGWHRLTAKEICRRLIPELRPVSYTHVEAKLEIVDKEKIDDLLAEIYNEYYNSITIWPITGLKSNTIVELDRNTYFRPLSIIEKLSILNFGMIGSNHDSNYKPENTDWFGLVFISENEKFCDTSEKKLHR